MEPPWSPRLVGRTRPVPKSQSNELFTPRNHKSTYCTVHCNCNLSGGSAQSAHSLGGRPDCRQSPPDVRGRTPGRTSGRTAKRSEVAQFGHKVIGIAPIIRAGEFDGGTVAKKGAAFDQQARMARLDAEQPGMFAAKRNGAQSLKRANRPFSGGIERGIERIFHCIGRRQAGARHRRKFDCHRVIIGKADTREAEHRRAGRQAKAKRFFGEHLG